ncbi:MAG: MFS transporter [Pseudomonadota bacterium]|nr:MFS transporter [Pseudomonadota bacterium]
MKPRLPPWLSRNVLTLGLVSLLNDAASDMIAPLFPIFLTVTLGGAPAMLGLVEGAADATASVLKLVSGRIVDRWGRRVPLVVGGYALAALTRPLLAMATGPWMVLVLRVTDRVGKGLRTTPRDALLAAGAPPERLGSVYGFHRAMDHFGAVIGALLAAAALTLGVSDLRTLFFYSAVPSFVALLLLVLLVREPPVDPPVVLVVEAPVPVLVPGKAVAVKAVPPPPWTTPFPKGRLRWYLAAVALFGLGHASDAFLLLKAGLPAEEGGGGVPMAALPLLWMALHLVKSLASAGAGPLADRFGRRRLIAAGWVVSAGIYVGFGAAASATTFVTLFVVYGLYHGLVEGAEKAVAAQLAEDGATGTALGWYHLVTGLVALPAGLLFGWLWTVFGAPVAFAVGATLALLGLVPLAISARPVPSAA